MISGNKADCPHFDNCGAPLCPMDKTSIEHGIWYPGVEEICKRRDFQSLDCIRKQRAIVRAKAPAEKYFTVPMLRTLKQVRRGIEGINADQALEKAREAERKWIAEKKSGRVIAKQTRRGRRVVAKKIDDLTLATSTSRQQRGGQK